MPEALSDITVAYTCSDGDHRDARQRDAERLLRRRDELELAVGLEDQRRQEGRRSREAESRRPPGLGYGSVADGFYREYLASDRWRERRAEALKTAGYRCSRCGKYASASAGAGLQVHHLTYAHLGQELPEDLQVVCTACHRAVHGKPLTKRQRARINRANAEADKMREQNVRYAQARAELIAENERLHALQTRRS
jgi:5-methylcytosine-specific restriction endonuclease McrA